MYEETVTVKRLDLEPMDPGIRSIQPGGGVCMSLELAWGRLRRFYLKTFRPRYVQRMRDLLLREPSGCPHEVLDPRDLKFHRNQSGDCWRPEEDPFAWRDRLPFARVGLAELILGTTCCLVLAALAAMVSWPLALIPACLAVLVIAFFRDPVRHSPDEPGQVVAPADGRIVSIVDVAHDSFIDGPAVEIGIFLSIFNVHINRVPVAADVIGLSYFPGKFLNAMRPRSAQENERLAVRFQENTPPYRRLVVRQIAGAIARRIVCWIKPGDPLQRGAQFGMIKLGSRTELVLPREEGLIVCVRPGQKVQAGRTVVAQFPTRDPERELAEECTA